MYLAYKTYKQIISSNKYIIIYINLPQKRRPVSIAPTTTSNNTSIRMMSGGYGNTDPIIKITKNNSAMYINGKFYTDKELAIIN